MLGPEVMTWWPYDDLLFIVSKQNICQHLQQSNYIPSIKKKIICHPAGSGGLNFSVAITADGCLCGRCCDNWNPHPQAGSAAPGAQTAQSTQVLEIKTTHSSHRRVFMKQKNVKTKSQKSFVKIHENIFFLVY